MAVVAAPAPAAPVARVTPARVMWLRFAANRGALVGGVLVALFIAVSVAAPWVAPYDPLKQDYTAAFQGPSLAHWLGTDSFGRDMLSRVIYGARISFVVGFSSVGIAMVLGVLVGLLAGYFGGVTDAILMRIVDGLLSFTPLVLAIAFIAVLGLGLQNVVLALAATFTGMFARVTRADVINMKAEPFVEAARLLGVSHAGVVVRHILPNVLSPIIVQFGLNLAVAILLESGLSFLGLGVTPPSPDLGLMIAEGRGFIVMAPWISGFPGLALVVIIVGLNLFGDGLRDALDPKSQIGG
ncbi:MAG TPA: ABC transporter permease [Candidatus Tectomicrobia bacterium]|nr:ABC transporter permease [Candidatus Tectomicrobia bacterium]